MTTAVKWLFVGLNSPWDLDLGSFDGDGWTGGEVEEGAQYMTTAINHWTLSTRGFP